MYSALSVKKKVYKKVYKRLTPAPLLRNRNLNVFLVAIHQKIYVLEINTPNFYEFIRARKNYVKIVIFIIIHLLILYTFSIPRGQKKHE